MCKIYVRSIEHVLVVKIRTHNQCNAVMLGPFFSGQGCSHLKGRVDPSPQIFLSKPNRVRLYVRSLHSLLGKRAQKRHGPLKFQKFTTPLLGGAVIV